MPDDFRFATSQPFLQNLVHEVNLTFACDLWSDCKACRTMLTETRRRFVVEFFIFLVNVHCHSFIRIRVAKHFGYIFAHTLIVTLDSTVTRISGELVTNHIKLKIMHKAKTVDVGSFDMPDFYERMENANREAGSRPIHILSSAFAVISRVITLCSFAAVLVGLLAEIKSFSGTGSFVFTVCFALLYLILSVASAAASSEVPVLSTTKSEAER